MNSILILISIVIFLSISYYGYYVKIVKFVDEEQKEGEKNIKNPGSHDILL